MVHVLAIRALRRGRCQELATPLQRDVTIYIYIYMLVPRYASRQGIHLRFT